MLKRVGLLSILIVATMALAQIPPAEITAGRGLSVARDKRVATFGFEVAKFVKDAREGVRGAFHMEQKPAEKVPAVFILMDRAANLVVRANAAEFGGPAVLRVVTRAGTRNVRGKVIVAVVDNRRPDAATGEPDVIKVHFKAAETDMTYDFAGALKEGDIKVRKN